jgi:hypothetical protein
MRIRRVVLIAAMVAGLSGVLTNAAQAEVISGQVKTEGQIKKYGADVKAVMRCTNGQTFKMDVTVTQKNTGARSFGTTSFTCNGRDQNFVVPTYYGDPIYTPGPANACFALRTGPGGSGGFKVCGDGTLVYPT